MISLQLEFNKLKNIPKSILKIKKLQRLTITPKFLDIHSKEILNILSEKDVHIDTPPHNLKFVYEYGGAMFWSGGHTGEFLPLSTDIVKKLRRLSILWERQYWPRLNKERRWSKVEKNEFNKQTQEIIKVVKSELGEDFIIDYIQ